LHPTDLHSGSKPDSRKTHGKAFFVHIAFILSNFPVLFHYLLYVLSKNSSFFHALPIDGRAVVCYHKDTTQCTQGRFRKGGNDMNWAAIVWLALVVLFLVTEAATVTVVSLWFAAGSLAAMSAALLGGPVWLQCLVFLTVSAIALTALRPLVRKYIKPKLVRTNVDSIIDSEGYVTEDIDNLSACGRVKLGGSYWSARSTNSETIPAGTRIRVDRVEGNKVYVTSAEVPAQP
jgi:membrane protein implicated in regulation of membrane protease activity